MTHMAPETLVHGQVSRASDVFAYGILLWELYTGEQAYKGIPRALLGHKITKQGLRPEFPADTPFDYQFLACRCWETDPVIRYVYHSCELHKQLVVFLTPLLVWLSSPSTEQNALQM